MQRWNELFGKLAKWLNKLSRRGGKILRWVLLFIVLVNFAIIVGILSLNYWLNSPSANKYISRLVQDKTGAKLGIGSIASNLPRSLTIEDINLQLPNLEGGWEDQPSIKIRSFRSRISLLSFFYGTFRVKEGVIEGLEIHATQEDGIIWTAGMQKYLAEHAEPPAEDAIPETTSGDKTPKMPLSLAEIQQRLALIFVPFRIKLENVGLKKLNISFQDKTKGHVTRHFSLDALDIMLNATAWLHSSDIQLTVTGSSANNQLTAKLLDPKFAQTHASRTIGMHSVVRLQDLKTLSVKVKTNNLPEDIDTELKLFSSDKFQSVELSPLSVSIGDIVKLNTTGAAKFLDQHFEDIDLDVSSSLEVNLTKIGPYLQSMVPASVSGFLAVPQLSIKGQIKPKTLAQIETAVLPEVKFRMYSKSLNLAYTPLKLVLENLSTDINVDILSSSSGSQEAFTSIGLQADTSVHFDFMALSPPVKGSKAAPAVQIKNFKLSSNLQAQNINRVKEVSLPKFNLEINIEDVGAKSPNLSKTMLHTPFALNSHGTTKQLDHVNTFHTDIHMGRYIDANFNLHCKSACQSLKLESSLAVPSIENIWLFAMPVVQTFAKDLPLLQGGSLAFDLNAEAKLPAGTIENFPKRMKKADGSAFVDFKLRNLSVIQPLQKMEAKGIYALVGFRGNLQNQALEVDAGVSEVSAPVLPEPLVDNRVIIKSHIDQFASVLLDQLTVLVPSLGFKTRADAKAELTDDMKVRNVTANIASDIAPENAQRITKAKALSATGQAGMQVHVESADLDTINIIGDLSLNQFNAQMADKLNSSDPKATLLSIKNMNGKIPFQQKIRLSQFKSKAPNPAPTPEPTIEPASTTKDQPVAESDATQSPQSSKTPEITPSESLEEQLASYLVKSRDSKVLADSRMRVESYLEVRPVVTHSQSITSDQVVLKDIVLSALEIDAEVTQNMFALNQLVFNVLGGKIRATAQVAFDPSLRQARFSAQCTELDTRRLVDSFPNLRDKVQSFSILSSSPYIDSTVRLLYDGPSGDIAGGLEVTRIGKEQLLAMLLYVDPEEKNPTIKTMRKALSIGEVRQVSVPIKNGQIGLDLDVRVLGIPLPTPKLQRFPLAQLVRNFTNKRPQDNTTSNSAKESTP